MKKIFSFLTLAVALLCSGNAWAGDVPTWKDSIQGKGTEAEPYLIDNYRYLVLTINTYGGHIKLTKSFDMKDSKISDIDYTLSNTATIDLNGFTISNTTTNYTTLSLTTNGAITLKDGSAAQTGCVQGRTSNYAIYCNNATITILGGTIKGGNNGGDALNLTNSSSAIINGGHFESTGTKYSVSANNSSVTINGGYFKGDMYRKGTSYAFDIKGGYFATKPTCTYSVVAGQDILSNNDTQTKTDYPYCLRDIKAEDKPFVSIGDTYFMSVDKAIASQISGDILLLRNALCTQKISTNIVFAQSDSTLTINGSYAISNGTFRCKVVGPTTNITGGTFYNEVTGRSQIAGGTFYGAVNAQSGISKGTYYSTVQSTTISGGTFTENSAVTASSYISGGTFNCTTAVSAQGTITNGVFATLPNVGDGKVSGGCFTGTIADSTVADGYAVAKGEGKSIVTYSKRVDGGKLITGGSYSYDVSACIKEGYSQVPNYNSTYFYVAPNSNLKDGKIYTGTYYESVSAFLATGYSTASAKKTSGDNQFPETYFVGKNVKTDNASDWTYYWLTSGSFTFNPQSVYTNCVTAPYEVVGPDAYGEWHVQLPEENVAASINGSPYPTLSKALNAVQANEIVVLMSDIVENATVYKYSGIDYKINLHGHKLSSETGITLDLQSNRGTNKTITIFDDCGTGSVIANSTDGIAVRVGSSYATQISIQGGTYIGKTAVSAAGTSSSYKATVLISGGKFDGSLIKTTSSSYTLTGGSYTENPQSLIPAGATYNVVDYSSDPTYTSEYKYVVQQTGVLFYEVTTGSCDHGSVTISNASADDYYKSGTHLTLNATPEDDYKLRYFMVNGEQISGNTLEVSEDAEVTAEFVHKDYICKNTSTNKEYESLKEAVSAVKSKDNEIIVYGDINFSEDTYFSSGFGCIINLQGHKINLRNHWDNFEKDSVGSQLGLSGKMTWKNGTINGENNYVVASNGFVVDGDTRKSNITFENLKTNGGFNLLATQATFNNCNVDALSKKYHAIYLEAGEGASLKSEGIIYSGNYTGKSGQTTLSPAANCSFILYGGIYNSEPNSGWLASGYQVIETSDPTYKYTVVNQVIENPVEVTKEQPKTIEEGQKVATPSVEVKEDAVLTIEQNASVVTTTLALTTTPTATPSDDIYGKSSQITGAGASAIAAQNVYIDITMDPSGKLNASQYYAFAVPFNVNINGGVQKNINGTLSAAVLDEDYRAYTYDGANRASQGKGSNWTMVDANGTFTPGVFYLVEFANSSCNTFRFTKASGENLNNAANISLQEFGNGTPDSPDAGWNGIANNSLQNASFSSEATMAQVFEPNNKKFTTISLNSTSFAIGTPFFIQATGANQKANNSVIAAPAASAPARMLAQTDDETFGDYTIRIKADGATRMADQLFVSASENASSNYVIGKDLVKMFMGNATVAQLWVNDYSKKLSVNQAVLTNDVANVSLTLYAPATGNYTVYLRDIPEDATIYLLQNGQAIANLNDGAYTVALAKGENTQYGLRINTSRTIPGTATSIDEALVGKDLQKVLIDGVVYIIRDGKMFNALGVQL